MQYDKSTERSMAKNWAVKTGSINWSRYMVAMKLGGDFLAAIILTVPFTAIFWPSDELLFSTALIKRAACKIVIFSRPVDLVAVIICRDCALTTFYERTFRDRAVFFIFVSKFCALLYSGDFKVAYTILLCTKCTIRYRILKFVDSSEILPQ